MEPSKLCETRQILNMADLLLHAFSCSCFIYFPSIKDNQYFNDCYHHFALFHERFLHTIVVAAQAQLGNLCAYVIMNVVKPFSH